jgi:hypothetical protein
MRRLLLAAVALVMAGTTISHPAMAQGRGGGGGGQQPGGDDDGAKKKKRDSEWGDKQAPLPAMRNAGPCPFVKTLYDASRYVEFKDNREAAASVAYTGEIQGISAGCQYKDDQPIRVTMDVLFEFGKGPQASAGSKTYRYWIAVTDRNREIITKQTFDVPVSFDGGGDRTYVTEHISEINIPRGSATTSGANFEVLIGFDVTPEMAAFNRDGKRFRPNAGATVASAGATQQK